MRELPRMQREHGASFEWEAVQIDQAVPPGCWNELIDRLDEMKLLWNYVLFLEDDVKIPERGIGLLFDRLFAYKSKHPMTVGATYQTHVFRQPRSDKQPTRMSAIEWKDEEQALVRNCGWYALILDRRALQVFGRPMFVPQVDENGKSDPDQFVMGQDNYMTRRLTDMGWQIVAIAEQAIPHYYVEEYHYKTPLLDGWAGPHVIKSY